MAMPMYFVMEPDSGIRDLVLQLHHYAHGTRQWNKRLDKKGVFMLRATPHMELPSMSASWPTYPTAKYSTVVGVGSIGQCSMSVLLHPNLIPMFYIRVV
ncbi:hypothetical protein L3X38_022147 [Prunus dulcis]|uniref:Uncharacterized protein n=1 Tax=Prunus dulcis TaxID=3755 RepID=A0AAD4Z412_PRUDU|nr:hypothetical protein L3X38_022147 [Prunus dulcis]